MSAIKFFVSCYREPYSQNPVLVSALNVVKGQKSPMDLIRVETKSLVSTD